MTWQCTGTQEEAVAATATKLSNKANFSAAPAGQPARVPVPGTKYVEDYGYCASASYVVFAPSNPHNMFTFR